MEKNIDEMLEYPKEGIISKVLDKHKIDTTLFCMAKGTEIGEHTSTKQGVVYVIEGKGKFNLEGRPIEMKKGKIIFMKENAKHSINAEKNTSFLLMLA